VLADRVDAEMTFAIRLDKVSSERYSRSFQLGALADCVGNFKQSCQAKARQAAELYENVH
jgi:hypothetical protein